MGTASATAQMGRGTRADTTGDEARLDRLCPANLIVGAIHLVQAVVVLALSNDFSLPIVASHLAGPPGTALAPPETVWDVPVGAGVALFLFLAAADHLLMGAPGIWPWYRDNLRRHVNKARWWEYSVSASVMIVLIAMVTGVSDIGAVVAIFGVNAAMIFFGLVMETTNGDREEVDWSPFWFGCVAGAVPWLVIVFQIARAEQQATDEGVPTFVYAIIVSLFVLFNSFAVNMALQYKRVGPWRDYLFGERAYIVLSLTAKTALAWQVFANTLV